MCYDKVPPALCLDGSWDGTTGACQVSQNADLITLEAVYDTFDLQGKGDPTLAFDPQEPTPFPLTSHIKRTCVSKKQGTPTLSLIAEAPSDVRGDYLTELGRHDINYTVVDQAVPPLAAPELTRAILIQDTTPPTIVICPVPGGTACSAPVGDVCPKQGRVKTVTSEIKMVFDVSKVFSAEDLARNDPGAAACDALDRALGTIDLDRSRIIADWSKVAAMLLLGQPGETQVTYAISDGRGNTGKMSRPVEIKDFSKPTIVVNGFGVAKSAPLHVEANLKRLLYTDAGATVTDVTEGDISSRLVCFSMAGTCLASMPAAVLGRLLTIAHGRTLL